MERAALSDPARHFLVHMIGSIERLDIILLMQRHADRWWTATALADELRIPANVAESGLDWLGSHNLLGVRIAQDVLYQYCPGTNELRQLVDEVSRAHYTDRGAIAAWSRARSPRGWAVGLIFLRLWRDSGDRLFAMFGAAFWVLSLNWIALAIVTPAAESRHVFYLIRLVAFVLIMLGIVDKNRSRGRHDE